MNLTGQKSQGINSSNVNWSTLSTMKNINLKKNHFFQFEKYFHT